MKNVVVALLLAVVSLCPLEASATFVEYRGSDVGAGPADARPNADAAAASFDAALGTFSVIDFEAAPAGTFLSLSSTDLGVAGVSIAPFGASTGNDTSITTGGDAVFGYNTTSGGEKYLDFFESGPGEPVFGVQFNFVDAIFGFGAYFTGAESSAPGTAAIRFDDGSSQTISLTELAGGGIEFLGFISDVAITSVIIAQSPESNNIADVFGIDDVRFGGTAVPEPATVTLLGLSMLGAAGFRRKKQA